jgi:hypothetical protein
MATVTLQTLWLSVVGNLSDSQNFPTMTALTDTPSVPWVGASEAGLIAGQTQLYSDGSIRAITQPGYQKSYAVTLYGCTLAQVAWIDLQCSSQSTLLVRDDRGRRFYAQFYSYAAAEHSYDLNTDVTITFYQVSGTDQV